MSDAHAQFRTHELAVVQTQIESVLAAMGMGAEHAAITAGVMADADLCGVDSHGIALLLGYADLVAANAITMDATVKVAHKSASTAIIDAGGGLGYVPSVLAAELVIEMSRENGLAGVAVRNSGHFGAAGYYTRMMAEEGIIGMAMTNGAGGRVAPTRGREPKLSTNPLAFAAPATRNRTFHLDMATSTVAANKLRIRANEGMTIPTGWAQDEYGHPLTDPGQYELGSKFALTPLGGTEEGSSFKGYGLAVMVELLSVGLSGASLVTSAGHGTRTPGSMDVGHFFLAIDPMAFREKDAFQEVVDDLVDGLHATVPSNPSRPVLVAGDREDETREQRRRDGIPIRTGLHVRLEEVCRSVGAGFHLS